MADEVLCSIQDGIATLTLNRPEKRNAINSAMMASLTVHFNDLEQHRDVRVVVLRGAGTVFCAGRDLREMGQQQSTEGAAQTGVVELFQQLETLRHPTIAMVQGDALAGGCELALHCDLRVAAEVARFGMPLARLGLVVPFELTCKLIEVLGPAFTRQFLFTAQPIQAHRAYEIGLVHQVVPPDDLEQATYTMARAIAGNAPLALKGIKVNIQRALSLREQIAHGDLDEMVQRTRRSADAREGVRAWLEKRPPVFRGE
jgi:enoyl-CoA hydratase/carnithine racemase